MALRYAQNMTKTIEDKRRLFTWIIPECHETLEITP
jgi:hypothetical protein